MDEYEQKALDDIEDHGCHILHVMEEDDYPSFTYSIGIEKTINKPDLIIIGLKREIAHWMINEYRQRITEGETFEPMEFYKDFLEGFDITFVQVDKKHYEEYLGWGLWYNKGNNFNMLQLVFPSTSGIWPWNESASEEFTSFQPLLNAS